jgi:hypothetical protein
MARDGRSEEEFQVRVRNMSERTMELGFSRAKIRHMTHLAEIGDAGFEEFLAEVHKRKQKVERNVSAKMARRLRREPGLS